MKSLIRLALLTSIAALISSCDSSRNDTVVTQPEVDTPEQVITGQVAGVRGAAITVVDANGRTVQLSFNGVTDANGNFTATISEASQRQGVVAPLMVTATGGEILCDWDRDGDNDCGDGISFGDYYPAPEGFKLRSTIVSLPSGDGTVTVNVNAITELTASIAGQLSGPVLMASEITAAQQFVRDMLESLTGTDLGSVNLLTLNLANLNSIASATLSQTNLVTAIYNASIQGMVDSTNANLNNVASVIAWLNSGIRVSAGGSVQASGTLLTMISNSFATGSGIVNAQLISAGLAASEIANSIITAAIANANIYRLYGVALVGTSTPPAVPQLQSVDGQVIKGKISGGMITVVDATGMVIPIADGGVTDDNGEYNASFTVGATEAGIIPPLTVTVSGAGAMVTCDYDVAGPNDCLKSDGTYASFGEDYSLGSDFSISGFSPLVPVSAESVTVNINPITDLAARFTTRAAAGTITLDNVALGNTQALGLVRAITGIDLNALGVNLRTAQLVDLTGLQSALLTDINVALSTFGASFLGQIDPTVETRNTLLKAIIAMADGITFSANGKIIANASLLARAAATVRVSTGNIITELTNAGLAVPSLVTTINANADSNARLFTLAGDSELSVNVESGGANAVADTADFIEKLAAVIDATVATTGAESFGGTQRSATEMFADHLNAIEMMSSWQATRAFRMLESALVAAETGLATGSSTELSGEGLSGTVSLSDDGKTLNITNVSATYAADDVTAVVEIASGWRMDNGDDGATIAANDVTLSTWTNGVQVQMFSGELWAGFVPEGDDIGLDTLSFYGWVTVNALPGDSFVVDIDLSNLTGTTSTDPDLSSRDIDGNYVARMWFNSDNVADLSVGFDGVLHAQSQNYSITADGMTIFGSVDRDGNIDTEVLTDLTTNLTLWLDTASGELQSIDCLGGSVDNCIGKLTVEGVETAGLDGSGTVWYSDGTIQSFPGLLDFGNTSQP
ncbi:MAG: hypothetical protein O2868_16680 [Proteobacteria bacterium]|nr:hypothetical protein [Pseudomonadota bacterium]